MLVSGAVLRMQGKIGEAWRRDWKSRLGVGLILLSTFQHNAPDTVDKLTNLNSSFRKSLLRPGLKEEKWLYLMWVPGQNLDVA